MLSYYIPKSRRNIAVSKKTLHDITNILNRFLSNANRMVLTSRDNDVRYTASYKQTLQRFRHNLTALIGI